MDPQSVGGTVATWLRAGREKLDEVANRSPARLTLGVFLAIIAAATVALSLPWATATGQRPDLIEAVFTAVSAVCVTGLTIVDTAEHWSTFGHVVIAVSMKVGGLGVMTLASILGLAVSRRISLTQRLLAAAETRMQNLGEVGFLIRTVLLVSVSVELVLTAVLLPRFMSLGNSFAEALGEAVFMSVSIFNNAGFVIVDGGLAAHVGDWWFSLPIILGAITGAVGFPVLVDILRHRRPGTWSLHTKLTVITYAALLVITFVVISALEWTNPDTLGELPTQDRLLASLVYATSTRSAGLTTIDVEHLSQASWFFSDAVMFVGGGSASTAGGIKVTTFAVLVLAIVAEARGDQDVETFGRRISPTVIRQAVTVAFLGATLIGASTLALLAMTDLELSQALFEVISAFATCGLSTGVTADLPTGAQWILATLMFAGRIGTMTVAAAVAARSRRRVIRMPEDRPLVG